MFRKLVDVNLKKILSCHQCINKQTCLKVLVLIFRRDTITLGGTYHSNRHDRDVDLEEKERIMEGCCKLEPSLKV